MTAISSKTLRLDSKGRLSLGEVTRQLQLQGLSGFTVSVDPKVPTRIILDAVVELSAAEAAEREAIVNLSRRDAKRLIEILDDDQAPSDELSAAAARFQAWERRD